jgi:hypothetical protein
MFRCFITVVIYFLITCSSSFFIYAKADTDIQLMVDNGSYVITSATHKIRLTPYGNAMIRLQSARITEDFF